MQDKMASKAAVSTLLTLLEVNFILSQCIPTSGRQIILQPVQQTCTTCCADQLQQTSYQPVVHYQTSEPIVVKPTITAVAEPPKCQNKPQCTPSGQVTSSMSTPSTLIIQEEEDQDMHPLLFYTLLAMLRRDCNDNCDRCRYSYNDNCDRYRYYYNDNCGRGRYSCNNNCDRCSYSCNDNCDRCSYSCNDNCDRCSYSCNDNCDRCSYSCNDNCDRYSYSCNDNCNRCGCSYNNDNCCYDGRNCCDCGCYNGYSNMGYGGTNFYDKSYKCNSCSNCGSCGSCSSCGSCGYCVNKCCDGNAINLVIRPNDCSI